MGFLKNFLGVATAADYPDMSKFADYIMAWYGCYLQLEKDHGDKIPHGMRTIFATEFAYVNTIVTPPIALDDMSMNDWTRILIFTYKTMRGAKLCTQPVTEVALCTALAFTDFKFESRVVYEELDGKSHWLYSCAKEDMVKYGRALSDRLYLAYQRDKLDDSKRMADVVQGTAVRCHELGLI